MLVSITTAASTTATITVFICILSVKQVIISKTSNATYRFTKGIKENASESTQYNAVHRRDNKCLFDIK